MNLEELKEHIAQEEGLKYEIYRCSEGYPTAGIGHLITEWDEDYYGKPIGTEVSKEQVDSWFEKDLNVAAQNKQFLNPVERGHLAFRTDNIEKIKQILKKNNIQYADYGNAFSKEWHQIFFHDPEGNVIEVHQEILKEK